MSYGAGGIELRMELAGEVQLHQRLEGIITNVGDLTPALEKIADRFQQHMGDVFASEGAATRSGRWAALNARYAAWKAEHFPGGSILVKSGSLRDALTGRGAGRIREIGPHSLTVGAEVRTKGGRWDLGMLHQTGGKHLPARRIIDLSDQVRDAFMDEIAHHVWSER